MKSEYVVPDERELSPGERALLDRLLKGSRRAALYIGQLANTRVVARCSCGCPTVDLAVGAASRTIGATTVVADASGITPEGVRVELVVHVREGTLSELEIYAPDGTKQFSLPPADTVTDVY